MDRWVNVDGRNWPGSIAGLPDNSKTVQLKRWRRNNIRVPSESLEKRPGFSSEAVGSLVFRLSPRPLQRHLVPRLLSLGPKASL